MSEKVSMKKDKNYKRSPMFLIALFNFLIIVLLVIYIIYLRFIPYATLIYDGYAVSGKDIANNLFDTSFEVEENIPALKVNDQDMIYKNLRSYYLGASKTQDINLDYPVYVNDNLALYNMSQDVSLVTSDLEIVNGYKGFTLTSGTLYNSDTLERADYEEYILMKNSDNVYISCKEIKITTALNNYVIPLNSIINFTDKFITFYRLEGEYFVYDKVTDIDLDSSIFIEDFEKKYTYKEMLIALGIMRAEENKPEIIVEDLTKEEEKEEPKEENVITEIVEEVPPVKDNEPVKWIKPEVTAVEFTPSTYIAWSEISINDPSGVICKSPTFTFYKYEEIAFRLAINSSGQLKATKLVPNTTYKVEGTYQYLTAEGKKVEATFFRDEFTTLGTENINTINLTFENGKRYYNKIELNNFGITSDINDEAIYGVAKATIELNGKEFKISSSNLKKILKGELISYQTAENLSSNKKYDYEIKFYDTNEDEMKLTNNTGVTNTSKAAPTVDINVKSENAISVILELKLNNEDDVNISNYRYEILSSIGEVYKTGMLEDEKEKIKLTDLNPTSTYIVNVYADFDMEDGDGYISNRLIASEMFTTNDLNKLGKLKLDISYDKENLKSNEIKLDVGIVFKEESDTIIAQILRSFALEIQRENGTSSIRKIQFTDEELVQLKSGQKVQIYIRNLESNTEYNILTEAVVRQGTVQKQIGTTYTTKNFITLKKSAEISVSDKVVTTDMIDLNLIIDDMDGAIGDETSRKVIVYLKERKEDSDTDKIIDTRNIYTEKGKNNISLTYTGLTRGSTYILSCEAAEYDETHEDKIQNNYIIKTKEGENYISFVADGLEGQIQLNSLKKEKTEETKNLINVRSENNWYSECFDTLGEDKKYNYQKWFNEEDQTLNLKSYQSYVYDLREYGLDKDTEITMSFKARVDNESVEVYIQNSKRMAQSLLSNEDGEAIKLDVSTTENAFSYTFKIGEDGYVGFYLPSNVNGNLIIKELQIKTKEDADVNSEYEEFLYDLKTNIDFKLIEQQDFMQLKEYYVKIYNKQNAEENFILNVSDNETENIDINEELIYNLTQPDVETEYDVKLIVKAYNKEYVLDTISFKFIPGKCEEIKSLKTSSEFLDIQPNGNYVIAQTVDLTNPNTKNAYTFGNENISFNGSIDFGGNILRKDTYSLRISEDITPYVFYRTSSNSSIRNVVVEFKINNRESKIYEGVYDEDQKIDAGETITDEERETKLREEVDKGIYSLFLYNDGYISDVILKLKECTKISRSFVGLLGYRNNGTINNFIINLNEYDQNNRLVTLYGTQYISAGCLYSSGIIKNGYIYGNGGIESYGAITDYGTRYFAGLVYKTLQNSNSEISSTIENVYNITDITMNYITTSHENAFASNIVYKLSENTKLKNVYSTREIVTNVGKNVIKKSVNIGQQSVENGPNVFRKYGSIENSFYFADTHYSNNNDVQGVRSSLMDSNYQNELLNKDGQFIAIEGYYPHVNMDISMPNQELISIEKGLVEIPIDILSSKTIEIEDVSSSIDEAIPDVESREKIKSEVLKNLESYDLTAENVYLAELKIYNPNGENIDSVKIDYVQNNIVGQGYSNQKSIVFTVVHTPTTYYNKYNISKVESSDILGTLRDTSFGESEVLGVKTISMRFIKDIQTKEEWNNIDQPDENDVSGLIQNYRITSDFDFTDPGEGSPSIEGDFTGYIDGQDHILSNISLTQPLVETLSGTFKNINIDNFTQSAFKTDSTTTTASKSCMGIIGDTNQGAITENIHARNVVLDGDYSGADCYYGGIIGYARNNDIINCSVTGMEVTVDSKMNSVRLGGIVGYIASTSVEHKVTNCYVQNLNFNVTEVTSSSGIGGIVGNSVGKTTLSYCYSTGVIISDKTYIGGIYGSITDAESSVKYCYSMVSITSNASSGTLYIGGIGGNITTIANNQYTLYLGNIYVKKADMGGVNRIVGSSASTTGTNYAYNEQRINGILSTTAYGAKLISKESKRDTSKYCSDSNMINGFSGTSKYFITSPIIIAEDGKGYINDKALPKLKKNVDSDEEMIWQNDMAIEVSLNITSLTAGYGEDTSQAKMTIVIENFEKVEITGFQIENMKDVVITSNTTTESGYTTVEFMATPTLYYDTYKLEKIFYKDDSALTDSKEFDVSAKIIKSFYKNISYWNYKEDENGNWISGFDIREGHGGQNYKVVSDINLGQELTNDGYINTNISVGRLEADQKYTISGGDKNVDIKLNSSESGLIKECTITIKNLKFEKINITASRSYIGVIYKLQGAASNLDFENINVNCSGYSYIGVISRILSGSVNNITLNKIKCTGWSYVGGLCGFANLTGQNKVITATYITINGGGSGIGGIFGRVYGGNLYTLKAYQYSAEGKKEGDTETEYLVKGGTYVGGCIGLDGTSVYGAETKYSTIKGTATYAGGVFGYTDWNYVQDIISEYNTIEGKEQVGGTIGRAIYRVNHLESNHNKVTGSGNYVGGVIGHFYYARVEGTQTIKSTYNTIEGSLGYVGGVAGYTYAHYDGYNVKNMLSQNNTITAKGGNYVGGVIGYANRRTTQVFSELTSSNNTIEGSKSYVGGVIGYSNAILKNMKTINCTEISGVSNVGGIVGQQTYNTTNTSSTYYSIQGAYVENCTNIVGTGSNVGGIAGYSNGTIYAAAVNNSNIQGVSSVGGIAGYYTGSTTQSSSYVSCQTFYIRNSLCTNSVVKTTSGNYVGGIAGTLEYGNIQYCYVGNTDVISASYAAGGFVGYLKNAKTQSMQYISKIMNNYIANTNGSAKVSANDQVGGVIGKMDRVIEADSTKNTENYEDTYLEDVYGSNLIVTNVASTVTNAQISMGIGNGTALGYGNQNENMFNTYVYYKNYISKGAGSSITNVEDAEENTTYTVVNYNWIITASNYTDALGSQFDGLTYTDTAKKFPTLKAISNWTTIGFVQNGIALPQEPTEEPTLMSEPMVMSLSYDSEEHISAEEALPKIYVYPVGVDKLNIEVDKVNENSYITIMLDDGTILLNDRILERVYSFEYDFNSTITIRTSNGTIWENLEYTPDEVRNKLQINGDEYIYLKDNKLYSNSRDIEGEYVNIYDKKVLSSDGKIYDISNMGQEQGTIGDIKLLEEQVPIVEYDYKGNKINTFYHCTKVIDGNGNETFKDKQMFIKNSSMYVLDGSLNTIGNAVIVDSYNDNQYEAVLGTDGRIYNFLTDIKYPTVFKNQDIIAMTNNINNNSNIVLVYYSTGKVIGFNYITGEQVYDNGLGTVSLSEYVADSLNLDNLLYNIENSNYETEKELAEKLEKVSIDEAIQNIESTENVENIEGEVSSEISTENNNTDVNNITSNSNSTGSDDVQYVIAYDTEKQSYVVYSSEELLNTEKEEVVSENEKIEANAKLENYYGNLSVGRIELKNIGVILFVVVILSIGIILIIMRKKTIK